MIGSDPVSLFLDESIYVEREMEWAANQHTHTHKIRYSEPKKYLYADDSAFTAWYVARTGNTLLNPLMKTTLM